jgi:hypothetical protein
MAGFRYQCSFAKQQEGSAVVPQQFRVGKAVLK